MKLRLTRVNRWILQKLRSVSVPPEVVALELSGVILNIHVPHVFLSLFLFLETVFLSVDC